MAFAIFILFLHHARRFLRNLCGQNSTLPVSLLGHWRCTVSAGVITGVLLVFLLLGYLVYALINAEAF
ncbi:K+-transporting ATPase, F subunit [Escherichia coli DEC2B]|uniref:K+-transporting ATPase, F subunit n=1 Tax=Escherichia coli DEC2D TaxID=868141 RepID=A0A828UBR9_ECOLX|nr:K+-transporting ATPase, F subunit [Escherichia coli 2362-75]EHU13940.1 K+-transporting ATPase, F subunit [Escherichia coli DEC1A]EHU16117.1 K+-transporting ATPase, F subunit [Escherichia coli DEC1C]EHU18396.1 K+-transporting ATPase, F subunit [Escherichia coli DEC1B]EHU27798.1 K+-transporting ATPase, F subunit [Escherichia coli DEC1D]EHU31870.1 K+-transporting ATPase, F subunit [Escherichia coli DEC1E]EHU33204.1 K+-transporting ATPase, F subunit [Escherichia coli DEC2A]EHU43979.1 K+-trans